MKLELKHLAIAFANKYKVTYFDDERELNQVCNVVELREDECTISNREYEYDIKFDDIKLLCFPLSALTKEITINGETFNPYDKINKKYPNTPQFTDYIKGWMPYYGIMDSKCEYVCILKLFEWKFDVFGLIDAGLAEPVTEDFNPYK